MTASVEPIGNHAEDAPRLSGRIPELDGVRGIAIAVVLIYHYVNLSTQRRLLYYALLPTRLMWSGVDLFFVLSGLLIGGILLDHRDSPNYFSVFYGRRIFRIFPIYYAMVGLLFLGTFAFRSSVLFRGEMPLWAFPLFAQNLLGDFTRAPEWIGVTWSLAVEEQFYLLFPFFVRAFSVRALTGLMAFIVIATPLLRTALIMHGWGFGQIHPLLPCRADTLAFGVMAAIIYRSERAKCWVRANAPRLYLLLIALFALFPTMLKWTTYWYIGSIGYSIIGLAYFLFIVLLLVAPIPLVKSLLNSTWLRWLGGISYCAYLVHQPVRRGLFMLFNLGDQSGITGWSGAFVTVAALALTLAVSQISWMAVEKGMIHRAHLKYRYALQN